MSAVVAVIGEGLLADFVCEELSDQYEVECQIDFSTGLPEAVELVLVLYDEWHTSVYLKAEEELQRADIPWLCGFVSYNEGVVGPLVRPGIPGCSQCADHRRRNSTEMLEKLMSQLLMPGAKTNDVRPSRTGIWHVAHQLVAEVHRVLQGSRAYSEEHVYLINLKTLKSSLHYFLSNPLCPVCGRLPDDSSTAARISLKPSPKINANRYRCRPIDELKEVLVKDYLDFRTGLFNEKWHHLTSLFTNVSVNLPMSMGNEITGGRSHSYKESELTAILEGLERFCGLAPRGKRTVIRDSFRNLAEHALDPVKAGVYSKEQYALPDFPFEPFDSDHPIDWVWGYSFLQERSLLVPELLAYYSWGNGSGFVQETSNGCALGGSLEEAILYGILEVVERDSFLMTWYAKLPVPRLDLFSVKDQELRLMVERLQAVAGYDLHLFNTTMENGIPSIWAIAKNRKSKGANLICAAGAHLDPMQAVKSAIHELANTMLILQENFEASREECGQMYRDSSLVQQMGDHAMLYSLPQAEERLQFLLDGQGPLLSFDEAFKQRIGHADLTDDLKDMLQAFHQLNLDVIVVDQTSLETLRNGLYCVKVLIPGMLPMTFGHHLTRLTGLERVLRIPAELGYAKHLLTVDELNQHPHPFP
jgi:ribosomal protein S12 methylthiotransferase accessory factor